MEEDNRGREYRYQKDWSIGGQMFHVRCDNWEEFEEAVLKMEHIIPSNDPFPNDTGNHATSPQQAINAPVCPIHNKPMSLRQGQYGSFYSCGVKNPDGTWCKYKPPKEVK